MIREAFPDQEVVTDGPQLTQVEAFDGSLPFISRLIEELGKDGLRDITSASLLLGGRATDTQGIFYKPQWDAYALLHLRAGFDEEILLTHEPFNRAVSVTSAMGTMATWELFRSAAKVQESSIVEAERSFDAVDYAELATDMKQLYNNTVGSTLAWAQIRDDEEQHGRQDTELHSSENGFANLTAHMSTALANYRGSAILSEDQAVLLETYKHLRDTRRDIAGDKRTRKAVRQLVAAMDEAEIPAMRTALEDADQQGIGVESMVRALWCRSIDCTVESISRLKEKRASTERAEARQAHMELINVFRRPEVSEVTHELMRIQAPHLYEEVEAHPSNAEGGLDETPFTVDTWVDDPLFIGGQGEATSPKEQGEQTRSQDTVPSAYVDRGRLAMLERIKTTWTVGAKSIGSLFEGKELRRYKTEDGEVFTDKYYGVVVPVYDKDNNPVSHFLIAESAVAGRNVTIVYRSDIGELPWERVARMSKSEARGTKGVRFLMHTKVGGRSVVETTEEKLEYLFACSAEEFENGQFAGETTKGELHMRLGSTATRETVSLSESAD